jgi:hypothetical protein
VWPIAERRLMVDWMYRYPKEGWFDDHPDASGSRREANDPVLLKVAGFGDVPVRATKSLKDS